MNRTKLILALPIMVAVLAFGCRSHKPATYATTENIRTQAPQFSSDLIGKDIKDYDGESIAKIDDLIVDPSTNEIVYAVISYDRGWTKRGGQALVPFKALELDERSQVVFLDADPRIFDETRFSHDRDAHLVLDPAFKRQVFSTYGMSTDGYAYSGEAEMGRYDTRYSRRHLPGREEEDMTLREGDIADIRTVEGEVREIGTYREADGLTGVKYTISTRDYGIVNVLAGPRDNIIDADFDVRPGDTITASGCHETLNGRSVFTANKVRRGNQTLTIESPMMMNGCPMTPRDKEY